MDAPSSTEDRERRLFLVGFLQGLSARIENIEWSHAHDSIVADIDEVVKAEQALLYPEEDKAP